MDTINAEQRSANMARIKSKNTPPELTVRRALYSRGLRYRLHISSLPGKPDICIKKYGVVVDVKGCLWHRHEGCKFSTLPKTNSQYWIPKIENNVKRDTQNQRNLEALGFTVFPIWECVTKRDDQLKLQIDLISDYIKHHHHLTEL